MSSRTSLTEASLRPAVLVLFACWLFAAMGQHGMWLDEMQHWCLARDSNDLVDLFHNTRNEGHPPLWHLLLFFITRTTSDPVAMQVLHGLIALCSIYLVLWHAPFPLSWRVLLVFGYFFAFEYAVISRNYGPTLLALLCATSCYRNRNYWGWAVACLFMAAGHLWGIVFAAVWATMDIYHAGLQRRSLLPPVAVLATAGLMVWRCIPGTMGTTGIELFGSPVPNMLARMGTITHMAML
ncbi:MAG: hypothetical protein KDB88_12130, partial [Flavobacteriales bacterium]|nr:hypothetical protein [Flavobacteriales bacterium]